MLAEAYHPGMTTTAPIWSRSPEEVLASVSSGPGGLGAAEAARRLERDGPNVTRPAGRGYGLRLFLDQLRSPLVLVLLAATVLSMALGELVDGTIILAMVAMSAVLGYLQERTAGRAVDALVAQVRVEVEVLRDGVETSVPLEDAVAGDVLVLRAGDVVAADARILSAVDLLVDESALTGESEPRHKVPDPVEATARVAERTSVVHLGTHVVSGTGTAVVTATGPRTEFGAIARELGTADVVTGFERGLADFGTMLVRVMGLMIVVIAGANVLLDRPPLDSLLFAVALAVGLSPELLPAIVSVSLSAGARRMARERVIVKRLDAIENLGGMTVLCTDKTGTITRGALRLEGSLDPEGRPDPEVARLARQNASLQRGFPNPLDRAILDAVPDLDGVHLLDEIPYDFERRRLSVLVDSPSGVVLITKGAPRSVMDVCTGVWTGGVAAPIASARADLESRLADLGARGLRVLALATRSDGRRTVAGPDDERDLVFRGWLVFRDPVKEGAAEEVASLRASGCAIRIVTGDDRTVARAIAVDVGLAADRVVAGDELAAMDDVALRDAVDAIEVFAEVDPLQKDRIIRALQARGEVVGFLGDGINDVVALHRADVGISVDSAVDVAKRAAAIVLLEPSLAALDVGIRLGRRTFANTLKYVRVTISANFGNMISLAAASLFLPFLPLLPRQILLLNLLSDVPALTISSDRVDPEQTVRPAIWSIGGIRRAMVVFGLISAVFDLAAFVVMRAGFGAGAREFQSGWFIASTLTEVVALLVLRTARPWFRSRTSPALLWTSLGAAAVTIALPYSALAAGLELVPVPLAMLTSLVGVTVAYGVVNELLKRRLGVGTGLS